MKHDNHVLTAFNIMPEHFRFIWSLVSFLNVGLKKWVYTMLVLASGNNCQPSCTSELNLYLHFFELVKKVDTLVAMLGISLKSYQADHFERRPFCQIHMQP